ncbi:MAG: type IV pilin N-terminal domain-containing protein [Candidatus Methanoperedens sp.]|nr:type IV pilin N-terminal domain-containing protein [Candidatus Methanoperedens sp.]
MTKEIRKNKHEDAVSPVIGVILMVVITVIIAAILAVFAFGIGSPEKTPQANLKYQAVEATPVLQMSHEGGEPLILKNLQLTVKDIVTPATIIYDSCVLDGVSACSASFVDPATSAYPTSGVLAPGKVLEDPSVAAGAGGIQSGQMVRVQILYIPTGQMISDTQVVVQ